MKKIIFGLLVTLKVFGQTSWNQLQSFPGTPRASAVMFIINDTIYAGSGRDSLSASNIFTKDFFKYIPTTNSWTPIADIPGERWLSTAFTIGNKGYVALGSNMTWALSELVEYNPSTNTWTQKAAFPGGSRWAAFSFVANGKAYVGGGLNSGSYNDLWEYDPSIDTWTQKANFTIARHAAIAFSINNKGYMGLGRNLNSYYDDFYEYDPILDVWSQKSTFPDTARYIATGFSFGNKGYAGLGLLGNQSGSWAQNDFWEYDPNFNTWTSIQNVPGVPRDHCVAASNNNKAYILGGLAQNNQFLNDFYSFPNPIATGIKQIFGNDKFSVYSKDNEIIIKNKTNKEISVQLFDILGKIIFEEKTNSDQLNFKIENLDDYVFVYRIITSDYETQTGKLIRQ